MSSSHRLKKMRFQFVLVDILFRLLPLLLSCLNLLTTYSTRLWDRVHYQRPRHSILRRDKTQDGQTYHRRRQQTSIGHAAHLPFARHK